MSRVPFVERGLVCAYFLVDILVSAVRQVARGVDKNLDFSISAIVSAFGNMVFAIAFVWWFQLALRGAIVSLLAASSVSLVVLVYRTRLLRYLDLSLVSREEVRDLVAYSWPMVPNSMSMWVMRMSDRLVVTLSMGVGANAVYAVANKIPSLITLAQSTFTMAWQENASIVAKDEDADAYYSAMFRTVYDLMAGSMGLLICITPLLFALLVRGDYDEAYNQMPLLFLGMFFFSQVSFLGGIYVAYKDTKSVGITTAAAVCNLVVDVALIGFIGLYAASGSTLISYLALFVFRLVDVQKLVRVTYDLRHLVCVLAVLVAESALCFMRMSVLDAINIVFGVVAFFVLNRAFVRTLRAAVVGRWKGRRPA